MAKPLNEITKVCTHERAHGTTVCLRCRQEERLAAQARRQRVLARAGVVSFIALVVVTAGALAGTALRRSHTQAARRRQAPIERVVVSSTSPAPSAATGAASGTASGTASGAASTAAPTSGVLQQGAAAARPATAPTTSSAQAQPPMVPILPMGATALPDSLRVTRTDSNVVLDFDTEFARTRRPDKFEQFVRTTLPVIYGAPMTAALASMPDGSIAAQGDLLTELPVRGVRIPVARGWAAVLYPETRVGRDGPLVVRYRVRIVPTT